MIEVADLERDYLGQMVAFHPDSDEYAVAPGEDEALRSLRARQPASLLFVRRIGPPTQSDSWLAGTFLGR